ncbi:MAG: hypothetical protein SangKO_036570 [Sandaracinaceae bacterium]
MLAGRYRVLRPLGEGGMGSVFEGEHVELDRPVAIKLLRRELVRDDRSRARFEREARLAAKLQHPHLVQVTDFGVDEGEPFMVMELVVGETLRAYLRREGPLEPAEALAIVEPLLRAVAAVHRAGVVHRDIKPDNVLLLHDDSVLVPKLTDFGIARGDDHDRITRTHGTVGTAVYMAPEQVRAAQLTGPPADQYALAVMLYEMLSGARPHDAPSMPELAAAKLMRAPTPIEEVAPDLPPHVSDAIMRALSLDPAARFEDVASMRAALLGEGEEAPRPSRPDQPTLRPLSEETLDALSTPEPHLEPVAALPPATPPPTAERAEPTAPRSWGKPLGVALAVCAVGLALTLGLDADPPSDPPPEPASVSVAAAPSPAPRVPLAHAGLAADEAPVEVARELEPLRVEEAPLVEPSRATESATAAAPAEPRAVTDRPLARPRPSLRPSPHGAARPPAAPEAPPTATHATRTRVEVVGYDSWSAEAHLSAGRAPLDACLAAAEVPVTPEARVTFTVAADGELVEVRGARSAPADLVRCARSAMSRVRWSPPIAGAGEVTATYALEP